jgi:hypothetical protein
MLAQDITEQIRATIIKVISFLIILKNSVSFAIYRDVLSCYSLS